MNTVYNDIPPVIRNKSEESETFQCEERSREHKWGLRMRHYLSLITLQWHAEVKCNGCAHLCVAHFQKRSANSIAGRYGAAVATARTTTVCG